MKTKEAKNIDLKDIFKLLEKIQKQIEVLEEKIDSFKGGF